jgi:toxin CptA
LLGLWLSGPFLAVLWYFQGNRQLDWRIGLAIASALGAGVAAHMGWRNSPAGHLVWDGEIWRWERPGYQAGVAEYELSVLADLQRYLLLRLENPARARLWLWVERSVMPERWLDLRRAVYSPHKSSSTLSPHDSLPPESVPAVAVSGSMRPAEATSQNP